jgi:rhomboid protease GluP
MERMSCLLKKYRDLPLVSAILVIANIIVFFLCIFTGDLLYDMGGVHRVGILVRHEYGRLLWALFLHADISHLFNNMVILFFLGSMLEKEIGHVRFCVIYFLSGIGGNVFSLAAKVMSGSNALSIGASGAVFGLDGLLLAMVLFSGSFRSTASPARVILMIVLSLYDGFMGTHIDNAAHVGGLVIGFIAGVVWCLVQKIKNRQYGQEVQI